jgi:hypothetical protein
MLYTSPASWAGLDRHGGDRAERAAGGAARVVDGVHVAKKVSICALIAYLQHASADHAGV